MRLLWARVHGLQTRPKRMTQDVGITSPQRLVLRIVGLVPGISAGTLAFILHVHPSTLTGVVQRLLTRKMVECARSDADRRVLLLSLTPKGARVNAVRRGTVEGAIIGALDGVPLREQKSEQRSWRESPSV
jgi:DNA-binding MarR family transcriptional regulator